MANACFIFQLKRDFERLFKERAVHALSTLVQNLQKYRPAFLAAVQQCITAEQIKQVHLLGRLHELLNLLKDQHVQLGNLASLFSINYNTSLLFYYFQQWILESSTKKNWNLADRFRTNNVSRIFVDGRSIQKKVHWCSMSWWANFQRLILTDSVSDSYRKFHADSEYTIYVPMFKTVIHT